MNIVKQIHESLETWGNHPAVIDLSTGDAPLFVSAGELKSRIVSMKEFLKGSGIIRGFIAAIFLENSVDFVALFLALIEIGAKLVPVNLAFRTIELDELMANADPHAIIAEAKHLPIVESYCAGRIVIQRKNGILKQIHGGDSSQQFEPADIDESIATINYTYRGFGYPLGALVPHSQYVEGAAALVEGLRPAAGNRMLVVLPFSYIFPLVGCLCVPLLNRITAVISGTVNPLHLFKIVRQFDISIITAVPEVYELMYRLKDGSIHLPSLEVFVSGGSVMAGELFEQVREAFNVEYLHGYGLTEFTPVSRNIRGQGRPGTIGPVCRGLECRIDSPGTDGAGEILIRTPHMAKGYFRRPAETTDAFSDGWFRTGDIGKMEEGHLVFIREQKGTRKYKGNMVDLEEIRRALLMNPKVREAEVACIDNILSAGIEIDSGNDFDENIQMIKKNLEGIIARYKIPKVMTPLDDEEYELMAVHNSIQS
ncbi:MAG: acyl--CoA ligase [Spirochaetes bacterium]|nr:acyl--CoA ligase [Spirochaetota bacterium]